MTVEREEKIINSLVMLLESNVGYQISFFGGLLSVYQLEDGRFAVNRREYDAASRKDKWMYEEIFEDARAASEFFEQKRREHQLGYDFERE